MKSGKIGYKDKSQNIIDARLLLSRIIKSIVIFFIYRYFYRSFKVFTDFDGECLLIIRHPSYWLMGSNYKRCCVICWWGQRFRRVATPLTNNSPPFSSTYGIRLWAVLCDMLMGSVFQKGRDTTYELFGAALIGWCGRTINDVVWYAYGISVFKGWESAYEFFAPF